MSKFIEMSRSSAPVNVVTSGQTTHPKTRSTLALETFIDIGLMVALVATCLLILRPFIPLLTWGIIIAVAVYPEVQKLQKVLGGHETLAATLCTLVLLAVVILPTVLLTRRLVQGTETVAAHLQNGTAIVPPPFPGVASWPIIGAPLNRVWSLASQDLAGALKTLSPRIKPVLEKLFSSVTEIGFTVLQFLLSILVAGVLLAKAQAATELTRSLANRLFGDRGPEFLQLIRATIRSVTFGVLGVAVIQSAFAAIGFLVEGLPAAALWIVIFLFAAVIQVGVLVLIPAVIYVFAVASTTNAIIFLVWCIFVALLDNILKPLLLGRGVPVPVVVVFLGAIGGFVAMGIVGLFVGAIVLSVGYELFLAWLARTPTVNQEA